MFVERYPRDEACKAIFREIKDTTSKWRKIHPKKKIKVLSNITVFNTKDKKDIWYLDTDAAVYMTHNLSLYITLVLNDHIVNIEIADGTF